MVRKLAESDLRVWELGTLTGEAPSLVSYHLGHLRAAGVVVVRRSAADGRDSYYSLDLDALGRAMHEMASGIHPGLITTDGRGSEHSDPGDPPHVLFICTGNSSRSQMAEGWLRYLADGKVEAFSAGTQPTSLHPLAVTAMRELGVDIHAQQGKHVDVFSGRAFDRVITLCDRAREVCPKLPASQGTAHWSVPNPSEAHPPDVDAFRAVAREVGSRVRYLLRLLGVAEAPSGEAVPRPVRGRQRPQTPRR
jgi:protein-tyrosine-phosphatase